MYTVMYTDFKSVSGILHWSLLWLVNLTDPPWYTVLVLWYHASLSWLVNLTDTLYCLITRMLFWPMMIDLHCMLRLHVNMQTMCRRKHTIHMQLLMVSAHWNPSEFLQLALSNMHAMQDSHTHKGLLAHRWDCKATSKQWASSQHASLQ